LFKKSPWGHNFILVYIAKTFKNLLMNDWPVYLDLWHEASF